MGPKLNKRPGGLKSLSISMYLAQSTNWGHFPGQIGISKCWFVRRFENRSTRRKTSQSKDENQQQTQPTYDAKSGNRTRATMVGGECSHHCAIPAPREAGTSSYRINTAIIFRNSPKCLILP